jgi:transposase-like protein
MYLMTSTRCGISAKQLEREIGVNYKTAARMMRLIRTQLMEQDDAPLEGNVEIDETYVGGQPRKGDAPYANRTRKVVVMAAVERGGTVRAEVMPTLGRASAGEARPWVARNVKRSAMLYTDESGLYNNMDRRGYLFHRTINHRSEIYADGDTHTQTVEGFFATVKGGLYGVFHGVSREHLQGYLNEFVYRYNTRNDAQDPFLTLLNRAAQA